MKRQPIFNPGVLGSLAATVAVGGPIIIMISGPIRLLQQCIGWLRDGYWTPHTTYQGLQWWFDMPYPSVEWAGVQRILDYLMATPEAVGMTIVGAVLVLLGVLALAASVYLVSAPPS